MEKLKKLQSAKTRSDLARLLDIQPHILSYHLYVVSPANKYHQFTIPKKSGGHRTIKAPKKELKKIQSKLSKLLLDCLDEINKKQFPNSELANEKAQHAKILKIKCNNSKSKQPSISHGFERKRSIITNAMMHIGQNNILNIDIENFFDSFNFGRVRGFFIKNYNFKLTPEVATTIAQIACVDNSLPQGSPCSPVITNLIARSLDIRLAALAKANSCIYTRYADDITFSTRINTFPANIMGEKNGIYIPGKKLCSEVIRSGFSINNNKTRINYQSSRQEVTGLVVNKKPSIKKEYWRLVRAQCHQLFINGSYLEEKDTDFSEGCIKSLEGKLNFIDQIDHYNRIRQKPPLDPRCHRKKDALKSSKSRDYLYNSREMVFSRFLFFKNFYYNKETTILTEGHTDNIYLKCAIQQLSGIYPTLTKGSPAKVSCNFIKHNERTKFLLELSGGADYLKSFIEKYKSRFEYFKAPESEKPVIIIVDNDQGPKDILPMLQKYKTAEIYPANLDIKKPDDIRKSEYIRIVRNLYLILTPLQGAKETDIEFFFNDKDRLRKYKGKCFNTISKRDDKIDLSKDAFARHIVKAHQKNIDFSNFKDLLDRVVKVQNDFKLLHLLKK